VAGSLLSESTLAERDMALVLREAELNRREAALRRVEELAAADEGSQALASSKLQEELEAALSEVDRRDRELEQAVDAVEAQRARLESVRAEYEERRDALVARTREVEAERNRLREERAQLVCASLDLEDRERSAGLGVPPAAPASITPHAVEPARPQEPSDADWWSKQLGSPLEAA
jgi:chromosome segregation ATPase